MPDPTTAPDGEQQPPPLCHVVLVNYAGAADIRAQLHSGALDGCRVVVVDNASQPADVAALCAESGADPVLLAHNTGFAGGVNAALRHIGAVPEPLVLLNPDVTLGAGTLRQLIERLRTERADAVAPLLRAPDGTDQVGAAGARPSLRSVLYYFLFLSHLFPRLRGVMLTRRQAYRPQAAGWLCMACLVVAHDAFDRYGPLPEDELVYGEDIAWGSHATAAGARLVLCSDVVVMHAQGSAGGGSRWIGAMHRLCRRELGPVRGAAAVAGIRLGLAIRRAVGRKVD